MTMPNIGPTKSFGRRSYSGTGSGAKRPTRSAADVWKVTGVVALGLVAAVLAGMAVLENLVPIS